jgi:hypothetical protein
MTETGSAKEIVVNSVLKAEAAQRSERQRRL